MSEKKPVKPMDRSKMSVADMLAAARAEVTGESAEPPQSAEPESAAAAAPEAASDSDKSDSGKPDSGKPMDRQKMSVAEMLAAARAEKGGEAEAGGEPSESAEEPAAAEAEAGPMDRSKMSVADMLAAARGEKAKDKTPAKPAAKAAAKPKPAAKAETKKPAAKAKSSGPVPKDTASILAMARSTAKKGPKSKKEAAVEAKPTTKKKKLDVPPMPERPAHLRPQPATPPSTAADRRGFFAQVGAVFLGSSLAVGFTSLAITHILWVLGLARFMFPNILTEPPTRFKVGFPDDFGPGQVETKYKAQFGVWIVRHEYEGSPQIYALKSVCTHLGCTPNWLEGEQKFKCPCHGSGFYKEGINFEGPAPRPLERYAIKVADDGQLEVDKSRKFQEELGQWTDGNCYVEI